MVEKKMMNNQENYGFLWPKKVFLLKMMKLRLCNLQKLEVPKLLNWLMIKKISTLVAYIAGLTIKLTSVLPFNT